MRFKKGSETFAKKKNNVNLIGQTKMKNGANS